MEKGLVLKLLSEELRMLNFVCLFALFSASFQYKSKRPHNPLVEYGIDYIPTAVPPSSGPILCNCGIAQKSRNGNRIIGGIDAERNEYPWQVGLMFKSSRGRQSSFCGGSLISSQHILTAAHCTEGISPSAITAFLGEHDITDLISHGVSISKVTTHPDYVNTGYRLDNDFSILTLSNPVEFSPAISPICLPKSTRLSYRGRVATVTGWGMVDQQKRKSAEVLQEVNITVLANNECNEKHHGAID